MTNVLDLLERDAEPFEGMTFQPGLPPLIDPLRFVGWRRVAEHWEIVTLGLSEFDTKETDDTSRSGFGVELVLRIGVKPGEEHPPEAWTLDLFQPLARMVFWSSQVPAHGSVLSFAKTEEHDGQTYRVYDEANPFDAPSLPLNFTNDEGFLSLVHKGMRTARPGHDGPPPRAGFGVWNTPVANAFAGLGFVNDSTFGVMQTDNGPVRWLRCLPLIAGATIDSFPPDGIFKRG